MEGKCLTNKRDMSKVMEKRFVLNLDYTIRLMQKAKVKSLLQKFKIGEK